MHRPIRPTIPDLIVLGLVAVPIPARPGALHRQPLMYLDDLLHRFIGSGILLSFFCCSLCLRLLRPRRGTALASRLSVVDFILQLFEGLVTATPWNRLFLFGSFVALCAAFAIWHRHFARASLTWSALWLSYILGTFYLLWPTRGAL